MEDNQDKANGSLHSDGETGDGHTFGTRSMCGGLSKWLSGREPTCQYRRHWRRGFNPWMGKIPWRRKWQPTPVFLPGKSHRQRSLAGYSQWGCKESDITMHTRINILFVSTRQYRLQTIGTTQLLLQLAQCLTSKRCSENSCGMNGCYPHSECPFSRQGPCLFPKSVTRPCPRLPQRCLHSSPHTPSPKLTGLPQALLN